MVIPNSVQNQKAHEKKTGAEQTQKLKVGSGDTTYY